MFRKIALIALVFSITSSHAQSTRSMRASGIVEAVIGNGDMKVARFARLLFIPTASASDLKNALAQAKDLLDSKQQSQDDVQRQIGQAACVSVLLQIRRPIDRLYDNAKANPNNSQGISSTDANEEGEFQISGLHDVPYTVIALGKVGMNAALWTIDISESTLSARIKLVKPSIACYDPNSQFKPN